MYSLVTNDIKKQNILIEFAKPRYAQNLQLSAGHLSEISMHLWLHLKPQLNSIVELYIQSTVISVCVSN